MSYGIDYSQCSSCPGYTNIDGDCNSEIMHFDEFIQIFDSRPSPKWEGKEFRVWTCSHCGGYLKHGKK